MRYLRGHYICVGYNRCNGLNHLAVFHIGCSLLENHLYERLNEDEAIMLGFVNNLMNFDNPTSER